MHHNLPFYFTQALDVLSNNLCKYGFLFALAFLPLGDVLAQEEKLLISNLVASIYIVPFFVVSYFAGRLADRTNKLVMIQVLKGFDVLIVFAIFLGFYFSESFVLLALMGVLGVKTAAFTPVKYGFLVQHVASEDLMTANGVIQTTSLVCIIISILTAGIIISAIDSASYYGLLMMALSVSAFYLSLKIRPQVDRLSPSVEGAASDRLSNQSVKSILSENQGVLFSLVSIGWFWFLGTSFMTQFMNFVRIQLSGSALLAAVALTMFVMGMIAGVYWCRRFQARGATVYLISGLGLSVLCFLIASYEPFGQGPGIDFSALDHASLLGFIASLGVFSTLFFVPLFTFVQRQVPVGLVATVMGLSSIVNACFVVGSTGVAMLALSYLAMDLSAYFTLLSVLNVCFVCCAYVIARRYLDAGIDLDAQAV